LPDLFEKLEKKEKSLFIHNDIINCACGVIPAPYQVRGKPGMTIKEDKFFRCANIYDALYR
jgi:hypothetical protein